MSPLNFSLGKAKRALLAAVFSAVGLGAAQATPVVYDFEGFGDLDALTNQIAGLNFSGLTSSSDPLILTSGAVGGTLNEFNFPPASGVNVLYEAGTGIRIDFSSPVFALEAYFIYTDGLSFSAFDATDNLIAGIGRAAFNFGGPGEVLSLSSAIGDISYVVITGAAGGGSFILDDLSVDAGNTVPEPQTLALVAGILGAGCLPGGWLRQRKPA